MAVRIQLRRDTAANWVSSNPTLRAGEIGIETDTLKFKVGNGSSPWNSITAYANVVPADLNTTLNGYLEVGDLSNTVAEIVDGAVYVPGTNIVFEGTANAHELTLAAPDVTSDKTITLPDATTTLVGTDVAQTLTNKTLTSPVVSGLSLSDSSIVFEGAVADSYETTLTVGEPTADRTITLPDVTGTVVTTGDTGSVTNTMLAGSISNDKLAGSISNDKLAGSISNDKLANSSVTINGYSISLGGSATYGTDNINEGTSNLYFTNERAQDAVATALSNGTHTNITVSYDDNANAISLTGAVTYTDENAQDAVGNAVGNGLDYDDNTGAISVDPSEFALSAVGAPTGNIDLATYKITNLGAPTSANDAATKAYVDNTTAGLNFHAAVHAATTANLDATYANGTGGVGATPTANNNGALVLDGHTLNADERVLVKNQTTGSQNGIYVVTATGDGSNPYILTRATDADNSPAGEVAYGDFCFVQNGGQAGYGFIVNTTGSITIGTTSISYVQFNAGQVVVAGNGLTETTPGTLAINTAVTVDLNTAQTLTNKTITGTFTGNLTGNADTVTNGVVTTGSYSNPSWITSLGWSKISSTPTTISGYGITNAVVTDAANTITAASASTKPLIIKAAASQSANLQEWQNSSGAVLARVQSDGAITSSATIGATYFSNGDSTTPYIDFTTANKLIVQTRNSAYVGLTVKGASSQSANLQEWQNSSGTVLANINSGGQGSFKSTTLTASSSGNSALTLVAASGQTAPLLTAPGGTQINSSGNYLTTPGLTVSYVADFSAGASNVTPIYIKGAASQSANLQEWQNSSGTVLATVASTGTIKSGAFSSPTDLGSYINFNSTSGAMLVGIRSASDIGMIVKGVASQSGNLQEWQNSSGTVLASVNASGQFVGDGSQLTGLTTALTTPSTVTLSANTATTVDTTALSGFTSLEYMVSLKQGSKVRTSKVVLQTDGTSVDMTEFAITETGGTMSGVVISATTSGSDAVLQATVTDASSTNVTVKLAKIKL